MVENYNQQKISSLSQLLPNTSGQGNAKIPAEIRGWNWGAFFLTWIWGLFHHVWLSLLALIPGVGFVMAIILGIKGNEWAWQAQHYNSVEEFKKREHKWAIVSFLVVVIPIIIAVLVSMILVGMRRGARAEARDAIRIGDLHNIQNALELYYAHNGTYPTDTYDSKSDWVNFQNKLTSANIGVHQIPQDPLNDDTYFYKYSVNSEKTDYVLGAQLETKDTSLNSDVDGTVYSIGCDDPIYCIRP